MSESNAMPIQSKPELERFVRLMLADYSNDDDSDAQMMEWLARKLMQAEQRVQELEAALEALLDTHNCDEGSVDYKGTETECPVCIPPRALLSKGAQS